MPQKRKKFSAQPWIISSSRINREVICCILNYQRFMRLANDILSLQENTSASEIWSFSENFDVYLLVFLDILYWNFNINNEHLYYDNNLCLPYKLQRVSYLSSFNTIVSLTLHAWEDRNITNCYTMTEK